MTQIKRDPKFPDFTTASWGLRRASENVFKNRGFPARPKNLGQADGLMREPFFPDRDNVCLWLRLVRALYFGHRGDH